MSLESAQIAVRSAAAVLTLSASTLVTVALFEDFRDTAYIPVKGDVPTIGYGSTKGVKLGDKITPARALMRLKEEVDSVYAQGVRRCVMVPLTQYEFGAFVSLTYNIGVPAFCGSTLVKKLNKGDYTGACREIDRWNISGGRVMQGLVKRRTEERKICEGKAD
jgi:lysozyme